MRRELIAILIGAALLGTVELDAQGRRNRGSERAGRDGRVEQLEPVRAPGRVMPRAIYRGGRLDRGSRVVYSSRGRYPAYRRGGAYRRSPVYGRASTYRRDLVWVHADWGRVTMRPFGYRHRRTFLNQHELRDILGRRSVDMVRDSGRRTGLRGSLRGHWIDQGGRGRLLVVTMDRVDVAEFVDYDGDGLVDDVFLIGMDGERWAAYGS
jgi:hypothetical protein